MFDNALIQENRLVMQIHFVISIGKPPQVNDRVDIKTYGIQIE